MIMGRVTYVHHYVRVFNIFFECWELTSLPAADAIFFRFNGSPYS